MLPTRPRLALALHQRRFGALLLLLAVSLAAPATVAYAAPSENLPVWRLQVRLVTGNGNLAADTDDDIQVSVNDNNHTWVDYGRNDFEVVDDFTYDLVQTNVRTLRDIQFLKVHKIGTDGWCVDNLTLLVNGQPIYYHSFRTATEMCRWVDANDGHLPTLTIFGSSLRFHPLWQGFQAPRPERITRAAIESRVEAIVGDWIESHDDVYKWGHLYGPRYVEVTPRDASSIHVDVDLTRIYNNWPNGEADLDFDLRFSCTSGRLSVSVPAAYIAEHSPYLLDVPPMSDAGLRDRLQAGLSAPLAGLNAMLGVTSLASCPTVLIDGGLNLLVPANPVVVTGPDPIYR